MPKDEPQMPLGGVENAEERRKFGPAELDSARRIVGLIGDRTRDTGASQVYAAARMLYSFMCHLVDCEGCRELFCGKDF